MGGTARGGGPLTAPAGPEERPEVLKQLRRVNRQLTEIRRRALQDSAVIAKRESLRRSIRRSMRSMGDSIAARLERMEAAEERLRQARDAGDSTGARSALEQLRELDRALHDAREKATERAAVRKRVEAFREALTETMRRLSPRADTLFSVRDSLMRMLRSSGGESPR